MKTNRRPIVRRDAEGAERTATSWASLTERLIVEAQAEGKFDALPGRGRPLELNEDVHAGDMALAHHVLRNAGIAPAWIEADKVVRSLATSIDAAVLQAARATPAARARVRARIEALADAHDRAIARLASLAPTSRQHRRVIDREALWRRLAEATAKAQHDEATARPPRDEAP